MFLETVYHKHKLKQCEHKKPI